MKVIAKAGMKVHNRFDVFIRKAGSDKEEQVAFAENIVLDNFVASRYVPNGNYCFYYIHFGSGTGILDPARTTLFAELGYKSRANSFRNCDVMAGYYSYRADITLGETEYIGQTLREVGVGGLSSGVIYTHALLCDMNGNPTSILKTSTDIITIYATVYLVLDWKALAEQGLILKNRGTQNSYFGLDHWIGTISNSPWSWTSEALHRGSYADEYDGDEVTSNFSGSSAALKKMVWNCGRVTAEKHNGAPGIFGFEAGGESGVSWNDYFYFKVLGIKDALGFDIVGETIGSGNGITTDFKTTWQLARNIVVKVDGVEQVSGITKDGAGPFSSSMNIYFGWIAMDLDGDRSATYLYHPYPGSSGSSSKFNTVYYENLISEYCGLTSMTLGKYCTIYASDDFVNWTLIEAVGSANKTVTVPLAYQHYKYWKIMAQSSAAVSNWSSLVTDDYAANNIHFSTPPGLVTAEAVGTGDGTDATWSLLHEPIAESLTVYLNGIETTDYDVVGGTITFNTAPAAGVIITADYRYTCAITVDYNTLVCPKDSNHVFDYSMQVNYDRYVAP